jgi:GTPase SAR1 family protein
MGDETSDKELLPKQQQSPHRYEATLTEIAVLPIDQAATHPFQEGLSVVLIGACGAGKSELLACLKRAGAKRDDGTPGAPGPRASPPTMGVDFWHCIWERKRKAIKLVVFDASGKDVFESVATTYMRRVGACVVACDLASDTGLMTARMWLQKAKLQRNMSSACTRIVLVGTKADSRGPSPRCIELDTLVTLGREVGVDHVCETSAIDGRGVLELFAWLVDNRPTVAEQKKRQQQNGNKKKKPSRQHQLETAFTLTDDEDGLASDFVVEESAANGEDANKDGCRCFCKYKRPSCCTLL